MHLRDPLIEFARYPDPLAPDFAARRAGHPLLRQSDVTAELARLSENGMVLVEGSGGVLVRWGADGFTLIDVAHDLGAPVVVVAAPGLGTLNHCALTVQALEHAQVPCAGIIIGSWPADPGLAELTNMDEIPAVAGVSIVGRIPAGAGDWTPERFTAAAPSWFTASFLPT